MTRLARLWVAAIVLLTVEASAQDPQEAAAPAKSILWSRTWDGALREAKIRNVPIYILVSIGEG